MPWRSLAVWTWRLWKLGLQVPMGKAGNPPSPPTPGGWPLGPDLGASPCRVGTGPRGGADGSTHKQQQTLVLPDGPAAAQEAEQEEQAPHGQEDVDARDEQGVSSHDLSEASGVHQDPDADAQQTGPAQLLSGQSGGREGKKQKNGVRY